LLADPVFSGKPAGQDVALGRPSVLKELGLKGSVERLKDLLSAAIAAIPPCDGAVELRQIILAESARFMPKGVETRAA
jgi:geranylgeranyl diphosphate synthase, type II